MSEMKDTDETRGLSQRELLLELRRDVKDIKDERTVEAHELGKRPTRTEIYSALGGAAVLMGLLSRIG